MFNQVIDWHNDSFDRRQIRYEDSIDVSDFTNKFNMDPVLLT